MKLIRQSILGLSILVEVDEEGLEIRPEIDRITDIGSAAIDYDKPVFGVQTEEEIIAESPLTPEPEPETSQETVQNISKGEAKKHLQALKMYLMKSSNDNSEALKSLAGIEQALVANEMQSSITSYFTV